MSNKTTSFYETFAQYNAKSDGDVKTIKSNNPNRPDITYLSWASSWQQVLKVDPNATYTIIKDDSNNLIHRVGKGAMVGVRVEILGSIKEEYYPIESMPMKSIDYENITPTAVNKAIKRGLTKCIALFGLGLNLYIGEDLTEAEKDNNEDMLKSYILGATTTKELIDLYEANKVLISSAPKLLRLFTARKEEIIAMESKKNKSQSRLIDNTNK